jgi:hypothetical protein
MASTAAKKAFDLNIERAGYFLELHEDLQDGKRGAPVTPVRELPRASVVFAVGALDAYLSDVSAEVLLTLLSRTVATTEVRDLLAKIQKEVPTLALEVLLLADAVARRKRVQEALSDHLYNKVSHHGPTGVATAVVRIGGKPADVWSGLVSQGFANPEKELDGWTTCRHEIVHQGKKPAVGRPKAKECLELVAAVAAQVDAIAVKVLTATP